MQDYIMLSPRSLRKIIALLHTESCMYDAVRDDAGKRWQYMNSGAC